MVRPSLLNRPVREGDSPRSGQVGLPPQPSRLQVAQIVLEAGASTFKGLESMKQHLRPPFVKVALCFKIFRSGPSSPES